MKPTILVAATSRWFPTARSRWRSRMPAASSRQCVRLATSAQSKTSVVRRTAHISRSRTADVVGRCNRSRQSPISSFRETISLRATFTTFIVGRMRRGRKGVRTCALIERSFGSPESFPVVYERAAFMRLAEEEGIRAPKTGIIANLDELRQWTAQMGFPFVLKADGTSGGDGVRIVQTLEDAERAFRDPASSDLCWHAPRNEPWWTATRP